jgi:hypothetical protein
VLLEVGDRVKPADEPYLHASATVVEVDFGEGVLVIFDDDEEHDEYFYFVSELVRAE